MRALTTFVNVQTDNNHIGNFVQIGLNRDEGLVHSTALYIRTGQVQLDKVVAVQDVSQ
jgi:hypothetical protein